MPFSHYSFVGEWIINGHMSPSCGAYILYGWANWLFLRVRVCLFWTSLRGAFSFDDLNWSFCHSLELIQERGTFNSYDESWFIHQSFLSHMDMLSLITIWCDVLLEDSSIMEVELLHNSSKPHKISKTFSSFPLYLCQPSIDVTTY